MDTGGIVERIGSGILGTGVDDYGNPIGGESLYHNTAVIGW
jgi:hypothetical protein